MIGALRRYAALHADNLAGALGRLARAPGATAMTVLVIAVALALPAGLRVLVGNVGALSGTWERAADFSVYLADGVDEARARQLAGRIDARDDVAGVELIPSEEALADFREASGFGGALEALEHNPLPHTLIVSPAGADDAALEALAEDLAAVAEVDIVQVDTEWVARLQAIVELVSRIVDVVTVLLALGVVLVIGNTIRLEINNRSAEIEVVKLVGGTDGFIRRPFLYLGLCYGLGGALVAAALIAAAVALLRGPALVLADLYGSDFRPAGLTPEDAGLLLAVGGALGWVGAALATARHLRAIEPQ